MWKTPGRAQAADSRRAELIRIAGEVFARSGYSGTSLRDVADAAGIQAGSLYHHFSSKESLAIELVTAFRSEVDALATASAAVSDRPLADVAEFTDRVADVVERHRAAVQMCMYDAPSNATEALSSLVRQDWAGLDRRSAALFDAAGQVGALRQGIDVDGLTFVLRTAMFDLALLPGIGSLRKVVGSLGALLLNGLAPDRPPFAELDGSGASRSAQETIAQWARPDPGPHGRRTEILLVARHEFAQRGYGATTVRDIAQSLEIRPSSLYRHFVSKQEILDAIMERFSGRLLAAYEAIVAAPGSAVERLDALIQVMTASAELFWPEMIIIKDWWRSRGPEGAESPPAESSLRLRLLESVLQDGMRTGQFVQVGDIALLSLVLREVLWIPLREPGPAAAADRRAFLRTCLLDGAAVRP